MQMDLSSKETWLHRINPSVKLAVLIVLFIAVLFIHDLNFLINLTIAVFILFLCYTGHPIKRILLFLIPFLAIFLSTSISMILFGKGETTWFKWGLVHISKESFLRGLLVGSRAIVFAALGLTFALTTRPVYLFYSLMQQVKLKPKYAYSFMAGLRLIPIMMEEFQTIQNAMKVRGVERQKGIRSLYFKIKAYSIPMLSGSIRRAHRIAVAMEAKRFSDTRNRTYYYAIGFSKIDLVFISYFALLLLAGYYVSIHFPYLVI
ncbi:energy-coupling factor transporter transmembrane protein EcfT [Bacillus sp. FJAT-29790]|uniref:energy-coupling factor transporter transmembrane component T family protein n=1 Tax=Bacillus sp. FJAT-29790 TaxID=1895002 RepID=UPI001C232CAD|nr:energy-coupling factor transporter transmembrane component T [Bacillus sp. FJAT-29790]MBU8878791.1 energy-coupling factor transporter transmembrane protein EcfT [Bacillus sp. FJAT-29790]